MATRKYPVCEVCGDEINPQKFDGCERYFSDGKTVFCQEHFREWTEELLKKDPEVYAALFGFRAVDLE